MDTFLCKAHSASLAHMNTYLDWYWSRKLNGFSMLWDGGLSIGKPVGQIPWGFARAREDKYTPCTGLWTSDAHIIHAPAWWYDSFPKNIPLQGEAWYNDSKRYSSVCNCAWKQSIYDSRWGRLKFMVYNYKPYCLFPGNTVDKDSMYYPNTTFAARKALLTLEVKEGKVIEKVEQNRVTKDINLGEILSEHVEWEGIMLASDTGLYIPKRSYNLLKLKPEYDVECTIVGHEIGKARHEGRMGSLLVELTWDDKVLTFHGGKKEYVGRTVRFNVGGGFDDTEREWEYVNEHYFGGKVITINFNEVGENGAIPSARIYKHS